MLQDGFDPLLHHDAATVRFDAMHTTISIDEQLLRAVRQRAFERETTLGGVIEDALRLAFDAGLEQPARGVRALPVSTRSGGTQPGIEYLTLR